MDKDIYIGILEFGVNKTEGFTCDEIINAIKFNAWEKKIIDKYLNNALINHQRSSSIDAIALETMFLLIEGGGSNYRDDGNKYILNYDSRFKYIDYIELKEAREMSRRANKNANRALWFAVATIIISIILTFWQITSSVKINKKQIDTIIHEIHGA